MQTWTKSAVDEAIADFIWSEWAQVGLSASTRRRDRWAIDPEALYLFSIRFGPREPRLFGELLDWLRENGRLMSAKRLRNLARDPWSRRLVDAALAWAGGYNRQLQLWAGSLRTKSSDDPDLELLADLYMREPDPAFAAFGFAWPLTPPSGKSVAPDVTAAVSLPFRLRLLLGTGSRSEIVRCLLTTDRPESSTAEVAHDAGFGKRIVNDALAELAESGVIRGRSKGRAMAYSLDANRWATFLGVPVRTVPRYVDWIDLLSAVWGIVRFFDEDSGVERSPYLRASEARRLVGRIRPELLAAGVHVPDSPGVHGADYWEIFQATVRGALRRLSPPA